MDTCKRMWSENQIGEIAKENVTPGITGVKIEYLGGVIEDGVVARMDFGNNYEQPYVIVSPTAPDPTPMLEVPAPLTKKLFGKSVLGEGNIDLYRHTVKITQGTTGSQNFIYTTLYSSKNTPIDSINDLKTTLNLSASETYPAYGEVQGGEPVLYLQKVGSNLNVYYMADSVASQTLSSGRVDDWIKTI